MALNYNEALAQVGPSKKVTYIRLAKFGISLLLVPVIIFYLSKSGPLLRAAWHALLLLPSLFADTTFAWHSALFYIAWDGVFFILLNYYEDQFKAAKKLAALVPAPEYVAAFQNEARPRAKRLVWSLLITHCALTLALIVLALFSMVNYHRLPKDVDYGFLPVFLPVAGTVLQAIYCCVFFEAPGALKQESLVWLRRQAEEPERSDLLKRLDLPLEGRVLEVCTPKAVFNEAGITLRYLTWRRVCIVDATDGNFVQPYWTVGSRETYDANMTEKAKHGWYLACKSETPGTLPVEEITRLVHSKKQEFFEIVVLVSDDFAGKADELRAALQHVLPYIEVYA